MASAQDSHVLQQAGSIWKMLDEMSLKNPKEYEKLMKKVKEGEDEYGPPKPQFSFKTVKSPKVIPVIDYYINVAAWKQIPLPKPNQPLAIPFLNSKPRQEAVDKNNVTVIDVVTHPSIIEKYSKISSNNDLLIDFVLKYLEGELKLTFSRKYKVLDEAYFGNKDNLLNFMCAPELQQAVSNAVQVKNEPIIGSQTSANPTNQITNETTLTKGPQITAHGLSQGNLLKEVKTKRLKSGQKHKMKSQTPQFEMYIDKESDEVKWNIYLPDVHTVTDCNLDLSITHLSLEVSDKYILSLDLPFDVNEDQTRAQFIKDQSILQVITKLQR